jgi:hypothetical protein
VLCVPVVPFVPLQLPDAVQVDAFVAAHVSCDAPPETTLAGAALSVRVGPAAAVTVTDTVCATEPPAPEQLNA